ncbi:hypothetical protein, partial [Paracoccus versutus]|uniref:hypothetical protein n=1 Tax=Paracoccus versutus TaxID=34007 RepID=UPI000E13D64F
VDQLAGQQKTSCEQEVGESVGFLVAGAGSNLHLLPEQVKMVAGTGVDHNLRSTPVKMVAGARNHLYRRSPAPNVILLIKQLEPDGSALFRAAA